ncbi:hypothetical protein PO909_027650, partial [Leuciscus waleckii]
MMEVINYRSTMRSRVSFSLSMCVFDDSVSVIEGDSVTLKARLTKMKDDGVIQWRFGDENTLIAEINVTADRITVYDDVLDGRFRDRLKLDNQTGSLTITNTRTEHTGVYLRLINSVRKRFSLIVYIKISVMEGDSVSLNSNLTEMKDDDVIQWRFGNKSTVIAEINKRANNITVYDDVLDGRFRDRLKLDNQTGSLTITNTTTEHAGEYKLLINNETKSFFLTVNARLPVPVISRDCSSSCSLVCSSVVNVEYQDKNTYSCVLNNPISNQTTHLDINTLCHTCAGT